MISKCPLALAKCKAVDPSAPKPAALDPALPPLPAEGAEELLACRTLALGLAAFGSAPYDSKSLTAASLPPLAAACRGSRPLRTELMG
jgi:hypothetical protein